jgi:hypothetical protein
VENLLGRVALLERRLQLLSEELSVMHAHVPRSALPAPADAANGEAAAHSEGSPDTGDGAPFPAEVHIDADSISPFVQGFYPREYDPEGVMFRWTGNGPLCELRFFIDRSTDRQFRMKVGDTGQDVLSTVAGFIDYAAVPLTVLDEDNVNYVVGTVPRRTETRLVVASFLLGEEPPQENSAASEAPTWLGFRFYTFDVS